MKKATPPEEQGYGMRGGRGGFRGRGRGRGGTQTKDIHFQIVNYEVQISHTVQ